jgi:hypothetical protein
MKCRLKSFSASRGVCPSPLAPVRSFGPIKASQMSPTIPILGRSRAAGLPGWLSRNSSTSSFIAVGSSSIASEVTFKETCKARILDLRLRKEFTGTLGESGARTRAHSKSLRKMERRYSHGFRTNCFRSAMRPLIALGAASDHRKETCHHCGINPGPKSWQRKS